VDAIFALNRGHTQMGLLAEIGSVIRHRILLVEFANNLRNPGAARSHRRHAQSGALAPLA
jgi:hypothetical protein